MSEQPTTPVGDAAVLGEHFAAVAAASAAALGPVIAKRVATWEPMLEQRGVSAREWEAWAPLVRAAVLCANPPNRDVAARMATDALSMAQLAARRKMPMKMENIFREGTGAAFLATVAEGSRKTLAPRVKALVNGVQSAAGAPTPTAAPAPDAGDEAAATEKAPVEPLLLDRGPLTQDELITAGLTSPSAAEALAALSVVRERVMAVEPKAMGFEPRHRGAGRAVPYGDVEVVALLAAAGTACSGKRRIVIPAVICLGVGAGVVGEAATNLKGAEVHAYHADFDGPAVVVGGRVVPLHIAFARPVLLAAEVAGSEGFVLGGRGGRHRFSELARGLSNVDAHLVKLSAMRLGATWLAMHAVRGVPVGDLIAAGGWTTTEPLNLVLPYLPRITPTGRVLLTGTTAAAAATEQASA